METASELAIARLEGEINNLVQQRSNAGGHCFWLCHNGCS